MSSGTGTQLEVCLVARNGDGHSFRARALHVEENAVGGKTLRIYGVTPGSSVMADLQMQGYFITKVEILFPDGPQAQEFDLDQESQNEAFETIKQFLDDEEGYQHVENKGATTSSPRRVEIIVRRREGALEERRVVVTGVMPPSGNYAYHSARGRVWRPYQVNLAHSLEHFSNTSHYLVRIICMAEGGGLQVETVHHLDRESQSEAWESLTREFSNLTHLELAAIRDWKVGNGCSAYGSGQETPHYYNRLPSAYQPKPPPVTYFRVAGDEIGVQLFRQQEERRPAGPAPNLQELIALEKKDITPASTGAPDCTCGHLTCEDCWETHMLARSGVRSMTVH